MAYYLKKFWKANILVIIAQIFVQIFSAGRNLIMMQSLNMVMEGDFRGYLYWTAIYAAFWGFYFLCDALQSLFRSLALRAMNKQVRRDMAATMLQMSHRDFHAKDKGEYLSWFTNGVVQIEENAWDAFFSFTSYLAQIAASTIALVSLHWSLTAAALLSAVIMLIVPKLFKKKMERMGEECAHCQEAATSTLKDLLSGYDVLRFFSRDDRFRRGVERANDGLEDPSSRRAYKLGFIYSATGMANLLAQILGNIFIVFLSLKGLIIRSAVFGGGNLTANVANGLNNLTYFRLRFATAKPYFSRITVHADDAPAAAPQGPEPVQKAISVENVSFRYDEKPVLENMSVRFEKGGKYALTGPSGCGKSTLLKLLLGWLPDYAGTIRFDGSDARDFTPEQLQQQMSYIAQDVFLFNTTIRDNITLGEAFTDGQLERAVRDSALAGDLENMPLGLDTPVGEEGGSLSGGQRQRVAIARALIHNRSILLVDEGTSALDQKNAAIVEESLLANPDLTLILVSHHLSPERKAQFDQVYQLETVSAAAKI